MEEYLIDTAKVMSKGQITIPKEIRERLGINIGDRITIVVKGNEAYFVNSSVYAMKIMNEGMEEEAKKQGIETEEDVVNLVKETRKDAD